MPSDDPIFEPLRQLVDAYNVDGDNRDVCLLVACRSILPHIVKVIADADDASKAEIRAIMGALA